MSADAPAGDAYRLSIRPPASGAPVGPAQAVATDLTRLEQRLLKVPRVVAVAAGQYEYGTRDADGVMTLQTDAQEVRVTIPRPWVMRLSAQVFALVFMTAEWLGWEVYDPQIQTTLKKESVLQGMVAMRQAQQQHTGARIPKPRMEQQPSQDNAGKDQAPWKRSTD